MVYPISFQEPLRIIALGFRRAPTLASAIASAFIDNIPYTATMVPVVIELANDPTLGLELGPPAWALALAPALAGMAQSLEPRPTWWPRALRGISNDISFNRFFRTGFPIMILTIITSTFYVIVRYAIVWDSNIIPFTIIAAMMAASLFTTPIIYGKFADSIDDSEVE